MEKKVKKAENTTVKETPETSNPVANTGAITTVIERTQSSCLIKTDAKGTKSYELKVYAEDAETAVEIALEQSKILDKEIAKSNITKGEK